MFTIADIIHRRELISKNGLFPEINDAHPRVDGVNSLNTCPSCGFPTLSARNTFEICGICYWEDDGQEEDEAEFGSGPNGYSLNEYRKLFIEELSRFMETPAGIEVNNILKGILQIERSYSSDNKCVYTELLRNFESHFDLLRKKQKFNFM